MPAQSTEEAGGSSEERRLVVTTPCSRVEFLEQIHRSIFVGHGARHFDIRWCVVFDTTALTQIPTTVLEAYDDDPRVELLYNRCGPDVAWRAHAHINRSLEQRRGEDYWHYVLDDDNLMHAELLDRIRDAMLENPDARAFVFSQYVGGRDFSGLETRVAKPENVSHSKIDQAQFLVHSSLIGNRAYDTEHGGDGRFAAALFEAAPDEFVFLEETLCYYNQLRPGGPKASLPRVLVVGREIDELRSRASAQSESDRLETHCITADNAILENIADIDPDVIVTFGADASRLPTLYGLPFDLRRRWIDVPANVDAQEAGERAYRCAITYILNRNCDEGYIQPLVSVLTPLCDTGETLWRTYRSVKKQSYTNWEWVVLDDSPHSGITLAIAREIAARDPRVRVHEIRPKSGGIVGLAKARAAAVARGQYLLELDHDDELTPSAIELLVRAFEQFPAAGFAYSDCALIDPRTTSPPYPEGFAFGYGRYYEHEDRGIRRRVIAQPGVNPKTIRHIVGVPNHFRAWRREVYDRIGGHNPRLSIADDYELIVRTFLETRMVHIPHPCYLQHLLRNGARRSTQFEALGDIQRRVRSISRHYEERIRERFAELGLLDWAAAESPANPLAASSRFGAEEQSASLEMQLPPNLPAKI